MRGYRAGSAPHRPARPTIELLPAPPARLGAAPIASSGPRTMSTGQAAHALRVHPQRIRDLIFAGGLPGAAQCGPGGHWRIPTDSVRAHQEA